MENSSRIGGRFKFSPCERRHLRSTLMEWVLYVQRQLGSQQHVAPETHACPLVTTETKYTNNRLDTPWQAGA